MKPSEIIRGAMQHVENGWCQGVYEDGQGNVCAHGALRKTAFGSARLRINFSHPTFPDFNKARIQLGSYARELEFGDIADLNDKSTQQDVLNFLEKTALRFEEQGQ